MAYPWSPPEQPCLPQPGEDDAQADVLDLAEERGLIILDRQLIAGADAGATTAEVLIIPGSGIPGSRIFAPRSRRSYIVHVLITLVALGIVLSVLFSFVPLGKALANGANPFAALAVSFAPPPPPAYITYQVLPGDTYERIAAHFGVSVNGIFKINHLYAGQEPQVGQVIRVSTDPGFGVAYVPPPLPVATSAMAMTGSDMPGSCLFCARGGWTNGPDGLCAVEGTQSIVQADLFALAPPNPGSHWVRGFTSFHNGIDISTGVSGTPIVAAQDGQVIYAAWDPFGGGNSIKVNHCGGLATSYSHLEKIFVKPGQQVHAGQLIGLQGSTGNSTGPHLHFMTWWNNVPFDPLCAYGTIDGVAQSTHFLGCPAPQRPPAATQPTPVAPPSATPTPTLSPSATPQPATAAP